MNIYREQQNGQVNSRRELFRSAFRALGLLGLGGTIWGSAVQKLKGSELVLRPPAAIAEKDFLKACIRCGTCVESCPYDTLQLAGVEDPVAVGTPFFTPRTIPCYMCPDVPCVPSCPSGALDIRNIAMERDGKPTDDPDINKARMGIAVIDQDTCLAYWGIQCDACYRACPLIGKAITLEFRRNEITGKHALLQPLVHTEACTGCGLCEHACVTEEAAIFVLPGDMASGKVGAHYIKSWDKTDEQRMEIPEEDMPGEKRPEDILNDWENLLGDD